MKRRALIISEILRWADAYRETTGRWPTTDGGAIAGAIGETWLAVDLALRQGLRTLPGGSSLARLLEEQRGKRNKKNLPSLSEEQILFWADQHFQTFGAWPTCELGVIPDSHGEKWSLIDGDLRRGQGKRGSMWIRR